MDAQSQPCYGETAAFTHVEADGEQLLDIPATLTQIRKRRGISQDRLAHLLGVSFVSIARWERGAAIPSPAQRRMIRHLDAATKDPWMAARLDTPETLQFASRGARHASTDLTLFDNERPQVSLAVTAQPPLLTRLMTGGFFSQDPRRDLQEILADHTAPAAITQNPPLGGMSAGKNTYTYDAHTYHTKVPPQGIAELLKHYLPEGGIVLDPFAGSGMTGVAARMLGYDSVLTDLSPAACFISNRITTHIDPALFKSGVTAIMDHVDALRKRLYSTTCRECGKDTEVLYTVWSYRVLCNRCDHEFLLWDQCRSYGKRSKEHKILNKFSCPHCGIMLEKSRLKRTIAEPVEIGYKCCGSKQVERTHSPSERDLELVHQLAHDSMAVAGYYPDNLLPDGVNLRQPKNHGLIRVSQFYTPRNLSAMSSLWQVVHLIQDTELAAFMAFVFTSLYQRVTRLSEFRFWGGSGNTARFNVPFIFNESNVFISFLRKARTIQDHLETTSSHYTGNVLVANRSAAKLDFLPDQSVDAIFTDPPFGANINYSEMNILWESWLNHYTDTTDEAIINRMQGKGIEQYQSLMTKCLRECYRVLRSNGWFLLVFMNSSGQVWESLRNAILESGFNIEKIDIFDKQHGTFKHHVSENTAGCDLVLHCRKSSLSSRNEDSPNRVRQGNLDPEKEPLIESLHRFLCSSNLSTRKMHYIHVVRSEEIDYRGLYSEWLAHSIMTAPAVLDFASFRAHVDAWLTSVS